MKEELSLAWFSLVALVAVVVPVLAQSGKSGTTEPPRVTAKDIKRHVGREVMVCGRVVMYDCEVSSTALVLDLDTPYSRRDGISIEVAREYWNSTLGTGLTNQYVFAQVCARGKAVKVGSRYRVVVDSRDAIDTVSVPPPGSILLDPSAVQSCAEGVQPPELLQQVKPNYTRDAMRAKQEGLVFLETVVRPDGSVGNIRVLVPLVPDLGLNLNAVTAVQQWRFKPGTLGGRPVAVLAIVEMKFTMR